MTAERARRACTTLLVVLTTGCSSGGSSLLLVDLRTDLVPGVEFAVVETERFDEVPSVSEKAPDIDRTAVAAALGEEFVAGRRVAELEELEHGKHVLRVRLLDRTRALVLERLAIVRVRENTAVTLAMTRSCIDVECPGGAEAGVRTCQGGACVDARCTLEQAEDCPAEPQCRQDSDCPDPAADCAVPLCLDGTCLVRRDDSTCAGEAYCDPDADCQPLYGDGTVAPPACADASCDHGAWTPLGASHVADSTERIAWSSASGSGLSGSGDGWLIDLRVDAIGAPLVTTFEFSPLGAVARFRRWNGTGWERAFPDAVVDKAIFQPTARVAYDSAGRPLVAWRADGPGTGWVVRVTRFDGTAWVDLDTPLGMADSHASLAGVAFDDADIPIVAFADEEELQVVRWDAGGLTSLGSPSAAIHGPLGAEDAIGAPALAFDGSRPVVAWVEDRGMGPRLFAAAFDGTDWQPLGAAGEEIATEVREVELSVDSQGQPVLAWTTRTDTGDQVYLRRWDGTGWQELAGSASGMGVSEGSGRPFQLSVAALPDGELAMAWTDGRTISFPEPVGAWVKHWNGSAWVEMGAGSATEPGIGGGDRAVRVAKIAAGGGRTCLAYQAFVPTHGAHYVYLQCLGGSEWSPLGGPDPERGDGWSGGMSFDATLAFAADGSLDVAWAHRGGHDGRRLFTKRFVDGSWVERTEGAASGEGLTDHGSSSPYLVRNAPRPVLSWLRWTSVLQVMEWAEGTFRELTPGSASEEGPIDKGGADARNLVTALDAAGNPWLAWQDHCFAWNVYVARLSPSGWGLVGPETCETPGVSGLDLADEPDMAFDPFGRLWLTYGGRAARDDPYQAYVKRFDGARWEGVLGSDAPEGLSGVAGWDARPAIVIDRAGAPWVAWSEASSGTAQIYVRRYDGTAWAEVGGSASGGGVSATPGHSVRPAMVLDREGRPIVVWSDESTGVSEIYARRWTGALWQELSGSATTGGISNSNAASLDPAADVFEDRLCVTWTEAGRLGRRIRLRCLDLGAGGSGA